MYNKLCGVYIIRNFYDNKIYVGKSVDIEKRLKDHKNKLKKNTHINSYLQNSWNKYGENTFDFEIVDLCKKEELNEREIYYIKEFKSTDENFGYNMTEGGEGGDTLSKHPKFEEIQKKIRRNNHTNLGRKSIFKDGVYKYVFKENLEYYLKEGWVIEGSNKGKLRTQEQKINLSKAFKGRVFSEERKEKLRKRMLGKNNHNYGKSMSIETRKKISESKKGKISFSKGKSLEELYGKEKADKMKKFLSESFKGKKTYLVPWSKGLTKETDERLRRISESCKTRQLSEVTHEKLRKAKSGKNNPRAKHYVFYSPCGVRHDIVGNLTNFCKEQNLGYTTIYKVLNNKIENNYKNWKIYEL